MCLNLNSNVFDWTKNHSFICYVTFKTKEKKFGKKTINIYIFTYTWEKKNLL